VTNDGSSADRPGLQDGTNRAEQAQEAHSGAGSATMSEQQPLPLSDPQEELRRLQEEFDFFLCAVAHDLRAPLRHIEGFGQLIKSRVSPRDADLVPFVDGLLAAAHGMRELLEALLQMCRLAQMPLTREPVEMIPLVQRVVGELQKRSPGRQVRVVFRGRLTVATDRNLLYLLLRTLLENAWKYTRATSPTIIELGEQQLRGTRVFYVRDNGVGFPSDRAEELFKPFSRLHAGIGFEGTGLGLTLARRIVTRLGGTLWAEGAPAKGACFYFTLDEGK